MVRYIVFFYVYHRSYWLWSSVIVIFRVLVLVRAVVVAVVVSFLSLFYVSALVLAAAPIVLLTCVCFFVFTSSACRC